MMITLTCACGYGHNNDGYISICTSLKYDVSFNLVSPIFLKLLLHWNIKHGQHVIIITKRLFGKRHAYKL